LLNDIVFVKFDRNPNFIPDDIQLNVVVRLRNQGNCSPCRMIFHVVITVIKSIIFKLKTINIYIYIYLKLFYNLNLKNIFNQTH
jgi:hypothetical protein